MATLDEARQAIAGSVTVAGVECLPYPPDNPSPPIAFIDSIAVDFMTEGGFSGGSFCRPGSGTATVVLLEQRNDREGAIKKLEDLLPPVLVELQALRGLQLVSATSGAVPVGGQDLPAVLVTVRFPV